MNTLALVVMLALAAACLGIPLTAVVVVCRDDIPAIVDRVRRALAFDPRHPALTYVAR